MNSQSFPEAFETRMKHILQDAWPAFVAAHQQPSPVSIRMHAVKGNLANVLQRIPWTKSGYYLPERPVFTLDPALHAGAYYVQEASSMFLEHAFLQSADLSHPLTVLDLCAAPGGKSTHLLNLLSPESLLVTNEVIRSRANILTENIQKWGHCNVVVTNNDPEDFADLKGFFDVIVADAPCSGEGLFRKDPNAMKEWSEENVLLCSKRQRRILQDIWPTLKENGILIYSTCTYNTLENEENLQWLKDNHAVEFIDLKPDPSWGIHTVKQGDIIGYHFYPHTTNGEGFFISAVRKKDPEQSIHIRNPKGSFASPSKKIKEQLEAWVINPENKVFIQRDDVIQFFLAEHAAVIEYFSKKLRLVSAGTFMATVKHDKLIPEHAMALSTELNRENFLTLELTKQEALQYLRKETLTPRDDHKGFALAMYEGLPLGWVNLLPNRINNLYPSDWRIRMS